MEQRLDDLVLISATENTEFAQSIARYLEHPLCMTKRHDFGDSDMKVRIAREETVRGKDVCLVSTFQPPLASRLQEVIVWTDALISGAADSLTIVLPYLLGGRQDRKTERGEPINARAYINSIIGASGEHKSRVGFMAVDLHSLPIQGFAMYFDNLTALPVFGAHIEKHYPDAVIVSPDIGGLKQAEKLARMIGAENRLAYLPKTKNSHNGDIKIYGLNGESVEGRTTVVLDDIIDSAGTLEKGCEALHKAGADNIVIYATHLVLSGKAEERLKRLRDQYRVRIVGTDTIYHPPERIKEAGIQILPISHLVGEAIRCKALGKTTRELYDKEAVLRCGIQI